MQFKKQAGFSVVEVILAAALFVVFSSGAIFVVLLGFDANRTASEETTAVQYASEGMEAARSIKNQNFANVVNSAGTGVSRSGSNMWQFSGVNNTFTKYTRVMTIASVQRDGLGNIVASGGSLDANTKKITATVSWNVSPSRGNSVILTSYLTNWKASSQASCLIVNTGSANRNHKQLLGITLQNTCASTIVLTQITPTWTQSRNRITQIQINGSIVWSSGGVGIPSGNQLSGTVLTILPVIVLGNSAVIPIDQFLMNGNIQPGESWTTTFNMTDGSQSTVAFITP